MQQQTLWQEESPNEEPRAIHLGDRFEMAFRWADGDTSPAQLERLAKLKEGTRDIIEDVQGGWHSIRILRTWVVEGCVRGLCEAIRNPLDGKNSFDPDEDTEEQDEDEETFER